MSENIPKEELMAQLKSLTLRMQAHREEFPKAYSDAQPNPPPMTFESALKAANPLLRSAVVCEALTGL